ncbi:kinesin light chain [Trifolium repens]|nr:kinesin light chain [Trifolium repens]KAK2426277.1 kinesin light chain [Trifolium repens]
MLAYKTISGTKNLKKVVHLASQFVSLILSSIGVWAAWKFHIDKGIDNFYSLHSWLGLACLFLSSIQNSSNSVVLLRSGRVRFSHDCKTAKWAVSRKRRTLSDPPLLEKVLYLQGKERDADTIIEESISMLETGDEGESFVCIRRLCFLSQGTMVVMVLSYKPNNKKGIIKVHSLI